MSREVALTGTAPSTIAYTVVIPTVGRPELERCLSALAGAGDPGPERVVVVDDRPQQPPLQPRVPQELADVLEVCRSGGRGPAGARNAGWSRATTQWVVFLDDDVVVTSGWCADLAADLSHAGPGTAGVQGRIEVPLPAGRRPTDWERGTAGLADSWWITADMAYRREALARVGGFDERFRRAFREDADLALRVLGARYELAAGSRRTVHPIRPAGPWASVRAQAGNADDALMRTVHGGAWRDRAGAPPGRRPRHLAITAAGGLAAGLAAAGRRRAGLALAAAWLGGTAEFAWARIRPGPRHAREIGTMAATSAAIPAAATYHWARGVIRHRHRLPWIEISPWTPPPRAVLFDRDGTLVDDEPYNGDPRQARPVPGAAAVLQRLRAAGVAVGVVSNQSGVARGVITERQVRAVNDRIEQLLGPVDVWAWCAHGPEDGCACRKPAPGLILRAAADLGVQPQECLVVGDIGSDIAAARAAGARCVLVPNPATRHRELRGAHVASSLAEAVLPAPAAMPGAPDGPAGPVERAADRGAAGPSTAPSGIVGGAP